MHDSHRISGSLAAVLRDGRGRVLASRRAHNTVVRSGSRIVAELFAGRRAAPVNGVAVGANPLPLSAPYVLNALSSKGIEGATAVALTPDSFEVDELPKEQRTRVRIETVLPRGTAIGRLAEAALGVLAADGSSLEHIYNRVVFDPLPKERDHELALYWEISFPYGV